ncbi:MAG TPA: outer membrane protein transport protein [Candidatus Omnitrophota bacterium]|nr:outer membrane protein transport protein [Candidatus Omnitrophota bacterium]
MTKKLLCFGLLATFIFMVPASAFAVGGGGFENASFSAKQLSLGGAATASPDEPAAISYNPAGIADLPGVQFQGDANFIGIWTFKNNDATGSTRSSGTLSMVPTAYFTVNPGKIFCDRLALGVGMDSPFGLMNKYNSSDPAAHYTGWRNYLKMYTIKPTIAYKITDKISLGGGPMWYRIYDFGGIQGYPNSLIGGAGTPDGQIRLNTSGNRWGWQMGTLVKLTPKHRLGYYFRSPVVVKTSGLAKVENSAYYGGNNHYETGVHTKVALPMNMTWAYAFQPTPKTHYEADFTWSHWKTHKRIYFVTDPTKSALDNAILENIRMADKDWRDSYGIQLGASHKLTKKLTLRGGSFFYWTPVPKDHYIPAVPDANHLAISLGLGYDITKNLTADAAYYNAFYFTRNINNSIGENAALVNSSVDGHYYSYMQSFTFSLTLHWDDLFPRAYGNSKSETPATIDIKPAAV